MKEVLGKEAKVVASPNTAEVGCIGIITAETKYTLCLGTRRIMKQGRTFEIEGNNIKGGTFIGKYEERIKG